MPRYASSTTVDSSSSKAEIERTLSRYGADQFASGWDQQQAMVAFRLKGRHYRMRLPMPDRSAAEFRLTPSRGWARSPDAQAQAYEQAIRQRWRALALVIKAKLEAVEAGISTLEDEFLAATMLPDGTTMGEWARDKINDVYVTGAMPKSLMPGYREPQEMLDAPR